MAAEPAVTQVLAQLRDGDSTAAQRLLPHVYEELRLLAGRLFQKQPKNTTMQPTMLVHEAYLKLVGAADQGWTSRKHFFDVAALAMRQLLTDHARRLKSQKRGGEFCRITLSDAVTPPVDASDIDLLALNEALEKLAGLDARQARIVELRYLAGLTVEETAEVLDVSARTVKLDWQMARSFLRRELGGR